MKFQELHLVKPLLQALSDKSYLQPSPIQEQAIPPLLKGTDLLGCAQTGTGKTAAFALPILQQLYLDQLKEPGFPKIKALIVTPTRELAIQIEESFKAYGKHTKLKSTVIYGGVKQGAQTQQLKHGVDILVATPGRLLDLMQQGFISLRNVRHFVLDEADHMLDMGFIHDIKRIIAKLPTERQSLFFSATMPDPILKLAESILTKPVSITIAPEQTTAERVDQYVYHVPKKLKSHLLKDILLSGTYYSTLVFSRTKYGADKIAKVLNKAGIKTAAIHGNKSQGARQRALRDFREGGTEVLVATDIAARGIDIDELQLVVNYDLPHVAETYVHRIGRTGRASASGKALSFCDSIEKPLLKAISKLIKQQIQVIDDHQFKFDPDQPAQQNSPKNEDQAEKKKKNTGRRWSKNKRSR